MNVDGWGSLFGCLHDPDRCHGCERRSKTIRVFDEKMKKAYFSYKV